MVERSVLMTDVNGDEHAPASIDGFAALLDELHNPRPSDSPPVEGYEEYLSVDLVDTDRWYLEFDGETVCFDRVSTEGETYELPYSGIDEALTMAAEFVRGDFAALRARPWTKVE